MNYVNSDQDNIHLPKNDAGQEDGSFPIWQMVLIGCGLLLTVCIFFYCFFLSLFAVGLCCVRFFPSPVDLLEGEGTGEDTTSGGASSQCVTKTISPPGVVSFHCSQNDVSLDSCAVAAVDV